MIWLIRLFCLSSALKLIWFILPLITGRDLNAGNGAGIVISLAVLYALTHLDAVMSMPLIIKAVLLVLALILMTGMVTCFILMCSVFRRKPEGNETVIVLGCRVFGEEPSRILASRIKAAAKWLKEHPESTCIVSGGKGDDENISEAEAMYRGLVNLGIQPDRIIKEDRSATTYENFRFSAKYIHTPVIVVTSEFHEYRACLIAKAYGLEAYALPAYTPWWLLLSYVTREFICIPVEAVKLKNMK